LAKKKTQKPKREVTKRQLSRWQQQQKRQRIVMGIGIFIIAAVAGTVGTGWYINQYRPLHQTAITVNDTEFNMDYYVKMLKHYGGGRPNSYLYSIADGVVQIIERTELIKQGAMELGISVSNVEIDEKLKSYDPPLGKDYRDVAGAEILLKKLSDEHFEQKVPVFAEQRHIMAMLLESENQVTEVRARLESGEDFGELAGELSLESFSKANNGDLGWRSEDVLTELLSTSIPGDYAFDSDVGLSSKPIYDQEINKGVGYWLLEVLEKQEEPEQAHVQAILAGSKGEAEEIRARLMAGEDFTALAKELSQHQESKENGGDLGWLPPKQASSAIDEFAFNPEVELEKLSEPIRDDTVWIKGGYWLVNVLDMDNNRQIEDDDRDLLKAMALNKWVASLMDDPKNEIDDSYLNPEKKTWAAERAAGDQN